MSAKELNAYAGTALMRTMATIKSPEFEKPVVLDIFNIESAGENQYDLPFYFLGQIIDVNFDHRVPDPPEVLGTENGYQHLYVEGRGYSGSDNMKLSWLGNRKFYTLTSATGKSDELLFTRIGANDPEFNLRRDAALMIRRTVSGNTVFASAIESHGGYSPVSEVAHNSKSSISKVEVLLNDDNYTIVSVKSVQGSTSLFFLSRKNASSTSHHEVRIGSQRYQWTGPYSVSGLDQ